MLAVLVVQHVAGMFGKILLRHVIESTVWILPVVLIKWKGMHRQFVYQQNLTYNFMKFQECKFAFYQS